MKSIISSLLIGFFSINTVHASNEIPISEEQETIFGLQDITLTVKTKLINDCETEAANLDLFSNLIPLEFSHNWFQKLKEELERIELSDKFDPNLILAIQEKNVEFYNLKLYIAKKLEEMTLKFLKEKNAEKIKILSEKTISELISGYQNAYSCLRPFKTLNEGKNEMFDIYTIYRKNLTSFQENLNDVNTELSKNSNNFLFEYIQQKNVKLYELQLYLAKYIRSLTIHDCYILEFNKNATYEKELTENASDIASSRKFISDLVIWLAENANINV